MKRFTIGAITVLTSAVLAACGSTAPTTTSPTTGAASSTSAASDTSATSAAGDMSATSAAGDMSATSAAGDMSATSAAGDMSATTTAGDTSATSAAGGTRATSSAGDMSATSAAGSTSATSAAGSGSTGASSTAAASGDTIIDVASSQGDFTTLLAALQATGLDQQLSQAGEYTVFAPTDEAFAALPAGTVEALLANPDLLTQILSYHVAQGELTASDIASETSVATIEGEPIQVQASGSTVTLNNEAKVTTTDIQTSNGVIHVIDKVLLPPNVTLPTSS